MFICLESGWISGSILKTNPTTHRNKESTPEESVPGVFCIIRVIRIKKHRPLVTSDLDLAIDEFRLRPMPNC